MTTTFSNVRANITGNPIQRAESLMLLRGRNGWWGKWAWRLAVALSVLVVVWPILRPWQPYFYIDMHGAMTVLLLINIFAYIKVMMSTLATASSAVSRERTGRTLDLLMLTGVDHWRFVLGKWTGVMRFMLRDYVWLWFLRVGVLLWFSGLQNLQQQFHWNNYRDAQLGDVIIDWNSLLMAALILLGFGFLELGLSSAIGIFIGLFKWANRAGVWVAAVLRIGVGLVLAAAVAAALGQSKPWPYRPKLSPEVSTVTITSIGSLFDNGALSSAIYVDENVTRYDYTPLYAVQTGQAIGALLYAGLTLLTLRLAKSVAVRQGINDNAFVGKPLPKRKRDRISTLQNIPAPSIEKTAAPVFTAEDQNIFGLVNASAVRAELYQYHHNVSRLHLRLMSEDGVQYIQFSGVAYLDVPSRWVGADFRVGSQVEYDALLSETGVNPNSLTANGTQLFIAETGDRPVRILATRAEMIDELPNSA